VGATSEDAVGQGDEHGGGRDGGGERQKDVSAEARRQPLSAAPMQAGATFSPALVTTPARTDGGVYVVRATGVAVNDVVREEVEVRRLPRRRQAG
jgi:hypothetical protein